MSVMMIMEWDGVTPEKYDEVRREVKWETSVPNGAIFHVASFEPNVLHVTDVWETAEDFQKFVAGRLMEGVRKAGIEGDPRVKVLPAHAVFAPAYETVRR